MNGNITAENQYTKLQQEKYDALAQYDTDVFDNFAIKFLIAHNSHKDYETYLWKDIPDLKNKDVLDFGCGPGRNLIHYHSWFKSIDGVDLAEKNLDLARYWMIKEGLDPSNFKLYKNDGISLAGIPSESYDVIMSTICLQHISVYDIRYNLLKEFYRVLRSGGYITLQLLFSSEKPNTVKYYDNKYDASDTNGAYDCVVEDTEFVRRDLDSIGFNNFHFYVRPSAELLGGVRSPLTDWDWLFVNAQK